MQENYERFRAAPGFRQEAFERKTFTFLVTCIAIAITATIDAGTAALADVVPRFRALVVAEMRKRWQVTENNADAEIEAAARDYGQLLFTDPETNRGLSLEWATRWLKTFGVEEYNPVVLLEVSHARRVWYVHASRLLRRFRVEQCE